MFAQNGNRVKPIQDTEAQRYLSLGYNILDNNGQLLFEAVPQDMTALKTAFAKHQAQIVKLSTELRTAIAEKENALKMVESLTSELEKLKAKTDEVEVESKPKRTRTKKATTQVEE